MANETKHEISVVAKPRLEIVLPKEASAQRRSVEVK